MNKRVGLILVSLSCVLIILCSCGNTRQLQYLQGQFDTLKLSQAKYPEPLIQKNDLVSITVLSDDPKASAYFNMPAQPTAASTAGQVAEGQSNSSASSVYLVDEYGNIQMPSLGKLHIAGLTKAQLDTLVISKVRDRLL